MDNILLLSTERNLTEIMDIAGRYMDVDKNNIFFVSNGIAPLQGIRIHDAYVDYLCYKDPNYEDCLTMILSNMGLTTKDGRIILV